MATLILISCSATKRTTPKAPLAAIERYDGVFFRVLRKARREGRLSPSITLVILSAKYGLLAPTTRIGHYEQRMHRDRIPELHLSVQKKLRGILRRRRFKAVYVNLGRDYAPLVAGIAEIDRAIWATGGIGTRAQSLKTWLTTESNSVKLTKARA